VDQFLNFLREIPGSSKEMWKGDEMAFTDNSDVYIGLFGEVPMGVVGIYEYDLGEGYVTILSVYM
jgi:hypothetical protein